MSDRVVAVRLRAEMGQYVRDMARGERATDQFASSGERAGSRMSGAMKVIAGSAAALGVAKLVKDSVELEAAYSKTMRQVAVATGAPAAELEKLDKLALKMGADTVFSAQDAADAMLELAKGGLSTAQIEAGALSETMTLAAAGGLDLGEAANVVVQAMGAFQLSANQTDSAVAALAGGANASSADVADMTQALAQAGTTANSAGLSIQDTTAYLALFADQGFKGSDAGTSLRTMLSRLVPQTDSARSAMESLGLSYLDANGQIVSAEEIAERTQKAFRGLTDEQRIAAVNAIFGMDAQRAVNAITAEGVEGFREYKEATSDLSQAQQLAQAGMEGTAGGLEQLSGGIETAKIQIGKGLAPTIERLAFGIADWLENSDVEGWAQDAGEGVEDFIQRVTPLAESVYDLGTNVLPVVADAGGVVIDVLTTAADVVTPFVEAFNALPESAQKALILAAGAKTLSNRLGPIPGLADSAGGSLLVFGGNAEKAGDKAKGAGGKFGLLATTMRGNIALLALSAATTYGFKGIQEGIDFFKQFKDSSTDLADTMSRDGRTTSATLEQINSALDSGRIGKYADDLDIDLDELGTSLTERGREGEYVQQVLADLNKQYDKSSAILGDLGFSFLTTDGEKVAGTRSALKDLIADLGRV